MGKTRLGLTVAEASLNQYPDGVWFVELAALSESRQVSLGVAKAIGIQEETNQSILETLRYYLRDRACLMLLDNCEHLIEACTSLADTLLHAARQLKILATSREPLGISGEGIFRVPSLTFPADAQVETVDQLAQFEAVRLFENRAQAVLLEFTITPENASLVARICWRLDGIPLAIELAAARVASLDLSQIETRLQHSFRLLTGGSRTALERHRTLRATIDWSYSLLSEAECLLLCRLSVFSGGFVLEAVEVICSGECLPGGTLDCDEILDLLSQLVNKSMIILERLPGQEVRYRMLETIRQYTAEKLQECGESEAMRRCHLSRYVQLAERMQARLHTSERLVWTRKFQAKQDNFFTALTWALEEGTDLQAGLRIINALFSNYLDWAHFSDLQRWLEKSLEQIKKGDGADQVSLVVTMIYLGFLEATLNKVESGLARMDQVLKICEGLEIDNRPIRAPVLFTQGRLRALHLGELEQGLSLLNQAESLYRELGDPYRLMLAWVLVFKSWTLQYQGDLEAAQACAEEGWELTQSTGDIWSAAGLNNLGDIALERREYAKANAYYQQWLGLSQEMENIGIIPTIYWKLARVEKGMRNFNQARLYLLNGLTIAEENSDRLNIYHLIGECCFTEIARARALNAGQTRSELTSTEDREHLMRAAYFLGKYQELMENMHIPVFIEHRQEYEQALEFLPGQLGQPEWETAMKEGQAKSVKELIIMMV